MTFLAGIRSELTRFSRPEKLFILFAMLVGFSITAEYGITRPASHSLFLTLFSAKAFPWVWLATVPLNLFAIYLYNRFLPKIGPVRMLTTVACTTIAINLSTAFILPLFPPFIFFQFAWKDIYILLMFKQMWSMIHTTISTPRAKYLYVMIYGMGTVGSILASYVPGYFAVVLGTEKLFLFTLPIYFILIFAYRSAFRRSLVPQEAFGSELSPNPSPKEGFSLIRRNRFLVGVLLLVVMMQVSVGLIEYQFNSHLELNILEKDLRTAYFGRLMGWVNILSGLFQILGGFLLVQVLGLRGGHLLIPLMLLGSALFSWAIPSFALISFSFIFLKAVDFSLFGVIREMLYIPLKLDEKFRAKAIIDVFAYRTSKALVAIAILVLQLVAGSYLLPLAPYLSIAVFLGWIAVVYYTFNTLQVVSRTDL